MGINRGFSAGGFLRVKAGLENVKTHHVAGRVVQSEGEEIEFDDGVEALGEIVEKCAKIALLGDDLADFEQGFKLAPGVFERRSRGRCRRGNDVVGHRIRIAPARREAQPKGKMRGVHGRLFAGEKVVV